MHVSVSQDAPCARLGAYIISRSVPSVQLDGQTGTSPKRILKNFPARAGCAPQNRPRRISISAAAGPQRQPVEFCTHQLGGSGSWVQRLQKGPSSSGPTTLDRASSFFMGSRRGARQARSTVRGWGVGLVSGGVRKTRGHRATQARRARKRALAGAAPPRWPTRHRRAGHRPRALRRSQPQGGPLTY